MPEAISLGGLCFEVRPLKLGQLRHVLGALEDMAGKSGGGLIEAAARVVAAGLAPAHPELTPEKLLDLEAGLEQLNDAVAAVLRIAGLRRPDNGTDVPGRETRLTGEMQPVAIPAVIPEALQEAAPATSSLPSTAPSPPAAPTLTR